MDDPFIQNTPFYLELRFWIVLSLVAITLFSGKRDLSRTVRPVIVTFLILLVTFFFYTILSASWTPDPHSALPKIYDMLLMGGAIFCIAAHILGLEGSRVQNSFWLAIFFFTSVLALAALYRAMVLESEKIVALGGGPIVFSRLMGLLLLVGLYFWQARRRYFVWLPLIILSGVMIVLSGSRGSMVAVSLAAVCFLLISDISLKRTVILIIAASVIILLIIDYTELGQDLIRSYQIRFVKLLLKEHYTSGRSDLYWAAYELGMDNFIIGAGLGAFSGLGLGLYPHNIFLEIFSESGIVGILLFLLILTLILRYCVKYRRSLDPLALAAAVMMLVASQFSGDLYDSRNIFVFMLFLLSGKEEISKGFQKRYERVHLHLATMMDS